MSENKTKKRGQSSSINNKKITKKVTNEAKTTKKPKKDIKVLQTNIKRKDQRNMKKRMVQLVLVLL